MKILMLNQKSGMLKNDIETYVTNLKIYQNKFVIFPSSMYFDKFISSGYTVGSQDIAINDEKNQTGELTGKQLSSNDIRYVIVGHSERRKNQNETKDILISKINNAIDNKLNIIYCVGEGLIDYKLKNTEKIIYNQLDEVLKNIKKLNDANSLYIAYEPIWAIGTGLTPSNIEISKIASIIKKYVEENDIKNVHILYGGSVNNENIDTLLEISNVDGFLVGGASCDSNKTIDLCEKIMNSAK